MVQVVKKAVAKAKATTSNVTAIKSGDNVLKNAQEKMHELGEKARNGEAARYEAATYFGAQVSIGLATEKDAAKFVTWYMEGLGRKMGKDSIESVASSFKSFANEHAQKREAEIRNAINAHFGDAEVSRGIDMFAAAYKVNVKINAAGKDNKPLTAAQLKSVVKEACYTTKQKKAAAELARKAAEKKDPKGVEKADMKAATSRLGVIVETVLELKGLTKDQKEALGVLKVAFKL